MSKSPCESRRGPRPRALVVLAIAPVFLACASHNTVAPAPIVQNGARPLAPTCDSETLFVRDSLIAANGTGTVIAALAGWQPGAEVSDAQRPAVQALALKWVQQCALSSIIALTSDLVAFPTVSAADAAVRAPAFNAMSAFLRSWAHDSGLAFEVFGDNDAWELRLGEGVQRLKFITHADVVPVSSTTQASNGYPSDRSAAPFDATSRQGRLYGRGAEDDKGSIAVVMVLMRAFRRLGLLPTGQVVLAMGTGEESDWDGMARYAAQAPKAKFNVSLDAMYPVVTASNGFVSWQLNLKLNQNLTRTRSEKLDSLVVADAVGGQFFTQVPGDASMTLSRGGLSAVELMQGLSPVLDAERTATAARSRCGDIQRLVGLSLAAHARAHWRRSDARPRALYRRPRIGSGEKPFGKHPHGCLSQTYGSC